MTIVGYKVGYYNEARSHRYFNDHITLFFRNKEDAEKELSKIKNWINKNQKLAAYRHPFISEVKININDDEETKVCSNCGFNTMVKRKGMKTSYGRQALLWVCLNVVAIDKGSGEAKKCLTTEFIKEI